MSLTVQIIVCVLAGLGAGLGTGFAGMSAAAVIGPMLIVFLNVPAYTAVGIALASDVLASGVSAIVYARHKNIDVKRSWVLMVTVLAMTVAGCFIAYFVKQRSEATMSGLSIFAMLFLGIRFLFFPPDNSKEKMLNISGKSRAIRSILSGLVIGFICGFMGAGGGIMMLLLLTGVLGYELKSAVGTSVFIMTFTALTGAIGHFAIDGGLQEYWVMLVTCIIATLVFAQIASYIANRIKHKYLNLVVGILLTGLGIATIIVQYIA
ncbi:MAG: sulfite exporter TauE/SafE family protein [Clostridiales bacterium]|nr:sulfite exporter TauE/SafE family protein [Clostridiales bacterium]